jgi:hypothetical protein
VLTRVLLRAASSRHGLLRSRRFCLRRPRGTPHEIDETERVGRLRAAAAGDMLVRAHQIMDLLRAGGSIQRYKLGRQKSF